MSYLISEIVRQLVEFFLTQAAHGLVSPVRCVNRVGIGRRLDKGMIVCPADILIVRTDLAAGIAALHSRALTQQERM